MGNNGSGETREEKFITLWAGTNPPFDPSAKNDCAIRAGWSPKGAPSSANRVITALVKNQKMVKALKKKGIDYDYIAERLVEQMTAMHPFAPKQPDNMARGKAIDMALKIHDAYPPARVEVDKTERKEIIVGGEAIIRLERYNQQREILEQGKTFDVVPASD